MSNEWAKQYLHSRDYVNGVVGRVSLPSGVLPLKIGHLPVINNQPFSGQKHTIQKTIARYIPQAQGGQTGSQTINLVIYNPSERLRGSLTVAFEPDDASTSDPSFVVIPQWSLRAMSKNPMSGTESPLQLVYPSAGGTKPLPDGYEYDTNAKLLRAAIILQDTNFHTSYIPTTKGCNVIAIAEWEPNIGIDEAEKNRLFSLCSLSAPTIAIIQNNAA